MPVFPGLQHSHIWQLWTQKRVASGEMISQLMEKATLEEAAGEISASAEASDPANLINSSWMDGWIDLET